MAISVNPLTFVISVPQADLTPISGTLYKLNTDNFRKELKAFEASIEGIILPKTHIHNTAVTLFGVTYARTIEIIDPYSITFTPDSQWSVRLDGSNNNIGDVEAGILNQNQVQVIPTNSAGLQDLSTLLASAYQGQVVINTLEGTAGTGEPIGTFFKPSNNMVDSLLIANDKGIKDLVLGNNITITEDLSGGYNLIGTSPFNQIVASAGADLTGCSFKNLTVTGELDGLNVIRECSVGATTKVSGFLEKVAFVSTVSFSGDALVMECYSNVPGGGYPTFTGVTGASIEVRDWHGSLSVEGIVDSDHTLEGAGGRCIIGSTCTGGNIHVRGEWFEIIDNSGASCTVYDERTQDSILNVAVGTRDNGTLGKVIRNTNKDVGFLKTK